MISEHGAWTAYEFMRDGRKVCYMASQPTKDEGNYTRRGDIFALITHGPGQAKDVFSYVAGYPYQPNSDVTIKVDSETFKLFTQGEMAWTPDDETDRRLSVAVQRGARMVVQGRSSRGTLTTDTFSLRGSGAAYKAISRACGVS